jgi:hypothetical protein
MKVVIKRKNLIILKMITRSSLPESSISVILPDGEMSEIEWSKIQMMLLVNTDQGPWGPDIFMVPAKQISSSY